MSDPLQELIRRIEDFERAAKSALMTTDPRTDKPSSEAEAALRSAEAALVEALEWDDVLPYSYGVAHAGKLYSVGPGGRLVVIRKVLVDDGTLTQLSRDAAERRGRLRGPSAN